MIYRIVLKRFVLQEVIQIHKTTFLSFDMMCKFFEGNLSSE